MEVIVLQQKEMYKLADERHNPPVIQNPGDERAFQAEIRAIYNKLLATLSPMGKEGDHYGVCDFAVRPDLRDRPTIKAPPAAHVREFDITILSRQFFRTNYLETLHGFLTSEARGYRLVIDQDFNPQWYLTLFLTTEVTYLYCTKAEVLSRLRNILCDL